MIVLALNSTIIKLIYFGTAKVAIKEAIETDSFLDISDTKYFMMIVIANHLIVLGLCVVNFFKAMIYWMPDSFRIFSVITKEFFEKNSLHWLLIMLIFFMPATLALIFYQANVYGFHNIFFAYLRVIFMGVGGGLF
jgi:hypothetical protein